jgi:hypothetical protein
MLKNKVEPDRIIACWMSKATITHPEYVIIIAFPQQQRLQLRVSILRYSTVPVLFDVKPIDS